MNSEHLYRAYQESMTARYGPGPWRNLPLHHRWRVWSRVYLEAHERITTERRREAAQRAAETRRAKAM